jgi:DNA repair protein RecO (recombination protein O)
MLKKDEALCIRTVEYSDTSQIVTLFGREHGKIDAMAKGSKRPRSAFEGAIEIFSYGQIVFAEAGDQKLSTLTEFSRMPRFAALRMRLASLNAALFGAELIESFTVEYDPHPELFDAFCEFLDALQQKGDEHISLAQLITFQVKLLQLTGGAAVFDRCVNCGTAYKQDWPMVYFSIASHGLICRDCEASFVDKMQVSKAAAGTLAGSTALESVQLPVLKEVEKLLIYHFSNLLHKPPKMAKYFLVR